MIAMLVLVVRDVLLVVPVVLNEVDRPAAGVVFTAVLVPMLLMPRWDMQVDRGCRGKFRASLYNDGLRVHQLGCGHATDIDLPIKPRLPDRNGHPQRTRARKLRSEARRIKSSSWFDSFSLNCRQADRRRARMKPVVSGIGCSPYLSSVVSDDAQHQQAA